MKTTDSHLVTVFKTLMLTLLALICFAANSVLCRLALGQQSIDPAGFTIVRLISGAVVLLLIVMLNKTRPSLKQILLPRSASQLLAPLMLFAYAIFFSYAYIQLNTASGALILFATVQFSLIGYGLYKGDRPATLQWLGILISIGGFILLMLPTAAQPPLMAALLMFIAGVSWAVYTLEGKKSQTPIQDTCTNFVRCIPLALVLLLLNLDTIQLTNGGILLAIASGALASGMGYALWYLALGGLSLTQAAISQLSVPLIAAIGGIIFVAEPLTAELILAGVLILGGITLVSLNKKA